MLRRDDGAASSWSGQAEDGEGVVSVPGGGLEPGYYDVTASYPGAEEWTGSVVVADGAVDQELRIGLDAGLSWWRETSAGGPAADELREQLGAMKLIGFGSVRDRISRNAVMTGCGGEPSFTPKWPDGTTPRRVAEAAQDAGIDVVAVMGSWPDGCDLDALYTFGQNYAKHMGDVAPSVEWANEPVEPSMFHGYPFDYASMTKAFAAGVKSVDPSIRILEGSSLSGLPFDDANADKRWSDLFASQAYDSNIGDSFDIRNEHWYPWLSQLHGMVNGPNMLTKLALDESYGLDGKSRWLTEIGYYVGHTGEGADVAAREKGQVAYTVESYAAALAAGYERVFPFYWQTLLENCGDGTPTTDNCDAVWGLTRYQKSDVFKDGRSQALSPRPALAAAAAVTRLTVGRQVEEVSVGGSGATVYFEGGVAVTWDPARTLSQFAASPADLAQITVRNMYGRVLTGLDLSATSPGSAEPYLLAGVTARPGSAQDVSTPVGAVGQGNSFRIEASQLRVNGQTPAPRDTRDSVVVVAPGDTISLDVRARAEGNRDVSGQTAFSCQGGESVTPDLTASGPNSGGGYYTCAFTVGPDGATVRHEESKGGTPRWVVPSYVKASGVWTHPDGQSRTDWIQAGLTGAPVEVSITGQFYVGQTVFAVSDDARVADYVWTYAADGASAPGGAQNQYTIALSREGGVSDFVGGEGRRIQVDALDASGRVLGTAWFRATIYATKGWADSVSAGPGTVRLGDVWAFDWSDLAAPGQIAATVGAACAQAATDQRYGPFSPGAASNPVTDTYPQATGTWYVFKNFDIEVEQTGRQNVYLYAVPPVWDWDCSTAVQVSNYDPNTSLDIPPQTPVLDPANSRLSVTTTDRTVTVGTGRHAFQAELVGTNGEPFLGAAEVAFYYRSPQDGGDDWQPGPLAQASGGIAGWDSFSRTEAGPWLVKAEVAGGLVGAPVEVRFQAGAPDLARTRQSLTAQDATAVADAVSRGTRSVTVVDSYGNPTALEDVWFSVEGLVGAELVDATTGEPLGTSVWLTPDDKGVVSVGVVSARTGIARVMATLVGESLGVTAFTFTQDPAASLGADFIMGVQSHLTENKWAERRSGDQSTSIQEIALGELGAESLRDELYWHRLGSNGKSQLAGVEDDIAVLRTVREAGGKLLMVLSFNHDNWVPKETNQGLPHTDGQRQAFAEYAARVVDTIGPENLAGIEIWNEWDILSGWAGSNEPPSWDDPCPLDPAQGPGCPVYYAQLVEALLKPTAQDLPTESLHDLAPGVPVIAGVTSGFPPEWSKTVLQYLNQRGVAVDGWSLHPYAWDPACPVTLSWDLADEGIAQCVEDARMRVAEWYDQPLPLYISELGFSSGHEEVSLERQAELLVKGYVRVRAVGDVAGIWWYDLLEDYTNNGANAIENGYGLISRVGGYDDHEVGEFKPAAHAYAALADFWDGCAQPTGDITANNYFQLYCADGARHIFLDATLGQLRQAQAAGGVLVDLLGGQGELASSSPVTDEWVGREVGVYGANTASFAMRVEGRPYRGQTVHAVSDVPGVEAYLWEVKGEDAAWRRAAYAPALPSESGYDPAVSLDEYRIGGPGGLGWDDYQAASGWGRDFRVSALKDGLVVAQAFFRPTTHQAAGASWLSSISSPSPGVVKVAGDSWAFDWENLDQPGRLYFTVGTGECGDPRADGYGPFPATKAWATSQAVSYPQVGGSFYGIDLAFETDHYGEQRLCVYAVPVDWQPDDGLTGLATTLGGANGQLFDLGEAPGPPGPRGSELDPDGSWLVALTNAQTAGTGAHCVAATLVGSDGAPYTDPVEVVFSYRLAGSNDWLLGGTVLSADGQAQWDSFGHQIAGWYEVKAEVGDQVIGLPTDLRFVAGPVDLTRSGATLAVTGADLMGGAESTYLVRLTLVDQFGNPVGDGVEEHVGFELAGDGPARLVDPLTGEDLGRSAIVSVSALGNVGVDVASGGGGSVFLTMRFGAVVLAEVELAFADPPDATGPSHSPPPDAAIGPKTEVGKALVRRGETQTVAGIGFKPGELVTAVMWSEPVEVGQAQASAAGTVAFSWTIPATAEAGLHRVKLTGEVSGTFEAAFEVLASAQGVQSSPAGTADLPFTGIAGLPTLAWGVSGLLLAGVLLALAARVRRRR
jgi:hypothetical protein